MTAILTIVDGSAWRADEARQNFTLKIPIWPGARYLTLAAANWRDAQAFVRDEKGSERALDLVNVGADVCGATAITESTVLRLKASPPPERLAIRAHSASYPAARWRRALPASLNRGAAPASPPRREAKNFANDLLEKPLTAVLAEIAADALSPDRHDELFTSASLLLRRLAAHPLDRSPGLGALVAALCQKERTL